MRAARGLVKISSLFSSAAVPRFSYETKLQAHMILLLRRIGLGGAMVNSAARLINKKTDYMSPYYHFLAMGNRPREYGTYLIKKYCPTERPNYANPPQGGIGVAAASFFDSALHFFGGLNNGWKADLPTGHDCLGWINLYLKNYK